MGQVFEQTDSALERLVERFDPSLFEVGRRDVRLRIEEDGGKPRDVMIEDGQARLEPPNDHVDAELIADHETWEAVATNLKDGMAAFRSGRLRIRRDLHLGVGFLAATAPPGERNGSGSAA